MEKIVSRFKIGVGTIMHQREKREFLFFRYPIFQFLISDSNLDSHKILFDKFFFLRLDSKDYLDGSNESLLHKIRHFLDSHLQYHPDSITLQTIPKMFGYVFNPVSFWLCFKKDNLDAVLCEVNNTFGDRHYYFLIVSEKDRNLVLPKNFHVSPFFSVAGHYQFHFSVEKNETKIGIQYFDQVKAKQLDTFLDLKIMNQNEISPMNLLMKFGWMTPVVFLRIHFLALRLWRKKVQFHRRPLPPLQEITK